MNEYEVAESKVLPYLADTLGWPEELIRGYGKVPVQVGTTTVWADYVCDIATAGKPAPWLLIEVKAPGSQLVSALPQAESYSLILGAPFFCITDGTDFFFYATRGAQGKSVELQSLPPLPAPSHLEKSADYITFSENVDRLADLFILGLKNEEKFYLDTVWHDRAPWNLHDRVFSRIPKLTAKQLKEAITENLMLKLPNRNAIFGQIDNNFPKAKEFLIFLRDFKGNMVANIARLIDKGDPLHIEKAGLFFVTQMLAGAHPEEFIVLEDNVSRALLDLGVTDIHVTGQTANGYFYINEICKELYEEKLKGRLQEAGFELGIQAVHNFLWHYYVHFRKKKQWFP